MSRPNTATERPCLGCDGVVRRATETDRRWHHDGPADHAPNPASREYEPPCACGRATAHLAEPGCTP